MIDTIVLLPWALAAAAVRPNTDAQLLTSPSAAFHSLRSYRPASLAPLARFASPTEVSSIAQSPEVQVVQSPFDRITAELQSYLMLEPGWDGEGSLVPTDDVVAKAMGFLRTLPIGIPPPKPMVSRDGAAELYWNRPSGYVDVSFDLDGTVSIFAEGPDGKDFFLDEVEPDFRRLPRQGDLLALVAPEQLRFVA